MSLTVKIYTDIFKIKGDSFIPTQEFFRGQGGATELVGITCSSIAPASFYKAFGFRSGWTGVIQYNTILSVTATSKSPLCSTRLNYVTVERKKNLQAYKRCIFVKKFTGV